MIRVAALRKTFGSTVAIDRLDLDLDEGRAYGVIGPNGSGKTTLFRVMTGLLAADAGAVEILAATPKTMDRRQVGYMPQSESLYSDLTIVENIEFFARICGLEAGAVGAAVAEVVALTKLQPHLEKLVEELSGGLARRTSLACAIVHRPSVLFLDEPTVGVDPQLRTEFWAYFETLKASGTTILVSTHHLDEAIRCDELVLLRDGKLLAKDAPHALLERTGTDTIEAAFLALATGAQ